MQAEITHMVNEYENGRMSRRQLIMRLGALFALVAGAPRPMIAQNTAPTVTESAGTFLATELNHIALHVTDVARSRDFYVKHLGMKVTRDSAGSAFLTCGKHFIALFRNNTPGMDHYCYSVKDYTVADAEKKLRAAGMQNIRRTAERIYFSDPDNLTVQLAAEGHMAG